MPHKLDLFTIVVLTAISAFLMGAGMIAASAAHSSQSRPLRQWGFSCLLQGFGWVLVGLRGQIPDWASIVGGNSAILISALCYWRSIDLFMWSQRGVGRPKLHPAVTWVLWLVAVFFAPILLFYTYLVPSLQLRIIIVSAALTLVTTLCARRLLEKPPVPVSRRLMSYGFAVVSASQIFRIGVMVVRPPLGPELFNSSPPDVTTFLGGFIGVVMQTFLFALMVNDHTANELRKLATHDSLTKLFNRSAFEGYARQNIDQALRNGEDLSLMLFDIDHFKAINDTFGHHTGDAALRQLARVATQSLRSQDIFGRYGGEEFAVLLPGTDAQGALLVAERVRRNIAEAIFHDDGIDFQLTISSGVSQLAVDGQKTTEIRLTDLFRTADHALYAAKDAGRNRTVIAP